MAGSSLPARFRARLRDGALFAPEERVLVALSGGLDSVCLLHLLRFALPELRLQLHAAHFDHALRSDSARDAQWVRGLCRAWSVPLVAGRAALPPRGEAAARALRYGFLQATARARQCAVIVTGHHADDQLETILFRLARGTGLRGLRGIPQRRGNLVRPLLSFRRAELAAYARTIGLRWREDESNAWPGFARNRIRHVLLPALEAAWPAGGAGLLRLAAYAVELEAWWHALLPDLLRESQRRSEPGRYELARGVVLAYHPQTRARVMRALAHRLEVPLDRAATRAAVRFVERGASGRSITLGGRLVLAREYDRLILRRGPVPPAAAEQPVTISAADEGSARAIIGGVAYQVWWGAARPDSGPSASFDPATLRFPLELRGWRPGDRIRLGYGTKKLKKLFAERRLPRSRRAVVPVLAEQGGAAGVLWVAGIARAEVAGSGDETWQITVSDGEPA